MNTAIQSGTTGGQFSSEEASAWKRRHDAWAELSGLLLYEYDSNSGNIFWGGSLREVTGYGPEEMTGGIDQWSVRVHPEDRAEALAALKDVQQSGERSEEHTSELQSRENLVCRLLLEKK